MKFTLHSKNVELTEKQKSYIEEKIQSLEKFFNNITDARVEIGQEGHHKKGDIYYAHVNLNVPGKTLRVEEMEPKIEKAIDKAKDDLQRELKKYKAKFDKKHNSSIRTTDLSSEAMYHEADMNSSMGMGDSM